MTDQLQTAKDWLGDLSKIVSQQKTKEDYEYAKKRTEALGWLINRVEELEEHTKTLESDLNKEVQHNNYLHKKNRRYKQALEFYADESNYEFETIVSDCDIDIEAKILDDGGEKARQGLKGESQ